MYFGRALFKFHWPQMIRHITVVYCFLVIEYVDPGAIPPIDIDVVVLEIFDTF